MTVCTCPLLILYTPLSQKQFKYGCNIYWMYFSKTELNFG